MNTFKLYTLQPSAFTKKLKPKPINLVYESFKNIHSLLKNLYEEEDITTIFEDARPNSAINLKLIRINEKEQLSQLRFVQNVTIITLNLSIDDDKTLKDGYLSEEKALMIATPHNQKIKVYPYAQRYVTPDEIDGSYPCLKIQTPTFGPKYSFDIQDIFEYSTIYDPIFLEALPDQVREELHMADKLKMLNFK